jgi:hypothetical protein
MYFLKQNTNRKVSECVVTQRYAKSQTSIKMEMKEQRRKQRQREMKKEGKERK